MPQEQLSSAILTTATGATGSAPTNPYDWETPPWCNNPYGWDDDPDGGFW